MLLTPAQILDSAVLGSAVASVCLFAIQPGQIFDSYWFWLDNLLKTRPMLAKPLGYCEVCTAGQVSFWVFLLTSFDLPATCLMCALAMIAARAVSRLNN